MTIKKTQAELRERIVRGYRKDRKEPRFVDGPFGRISVMHDPAPEWVVAVVDALLPRLRGEADLGAGLVARALRWCELGDMEDRAGHIIQLVHLWRGPRAPMLGMFIANAFKTSAGKARKVPIVGVREPFADLEAPTAKEVADAINANPAIAHTATAVGGAGGSSVFGGGGGGGGAAAPGAWSGGTGGNDGVRLGGRGGASPGAPGEPGASIGGGIGGAGGAGGSSR